MVSIGEMSVTEVRAMAENIMASPIWNIHSQCVSFLSSVGRHCLR